MYLSNQVSQLNSANNFLQQQANEDYNKKMQALQALQLAIKTGKEDQRDLWQKRMDRSGLIGMLGDIKDALGGGKRQKLNPSTLTIPGGTGGQGESGTPVIAMKDAVMGNKGAIEQAQRNLLLDKKLNDKQQAYMLADKAHRAKTGQPLSIKEFNEKYENQVTKDSELVDNSKIREDYVGKAGDIFKNSSLNESMSDKQKAYFIANKEHYAKTGQPLPIDQFNLMYEDQKTKPEVTDNAENRVDFLKQVQAEKDIQGDQQALLKEQAGIDKYNKEAAAKNASAQTSEDPFVSHMKQSGNLVKSFEGNWGDMSSQNLAMFREAYNYWIDRDPRKARQILGEYKLNQQQINKYWNEDGNAGMAFDAFKAQKGGEKMYEVDVSVLQKGGDQMLPQGKMLIPASIYADRKKALAYMKKQFGVDLDDVQLHKSSEDSQVASKVRSEGLKNEFKNTGIPLSDGSYISVVQGKVKKFTPYQDDKGKVVYSEKYISDPDGKYAKIIKAKKEKLAGL